MGLGSGIGGTLRVPGRGLRRVLAVLVVLVLAAGLGGAVALSAPGLAQRIGLGSAPEATLPAAAEPVLRPLPADAPRPTEEGVAAALDPLVDPTSLGEFSGVVLDPADATVLWADQPDRALAPGSTVKLLTAAAALLTLNPTDGLVTRAVAGDEPGTVVLVGGGDPTLTALPPEQDGVYPAPTRLAALAEQVRAAAPGPIERVVVDTSRYGDDPLAAGWEPGDVPGGFVAPIGSLMVDGGRVDPGEQDGARVEEPALAAGRAFADLLGSDAQVLDGVAGRDAAPLGSVASGPVSSLVEHMVRSSDNVLAEVLAREVALARGAPPTFAAATREVLATLEQAGLDPSGTELLDGSGLSREQRVPVRLVGEVLAVAASPADGAPQPLRPIVAGLPVAGGVGTLVDRFGDDGGTADGRGTVRAKTGTLTGVSSLAGVVTDADGRLLVFALASNGTSPVAARPELDAIAAALSRCGCR